MSQKESKRKWQTGSNRLHDAKKPLMKTVNMLSFGGGVDSTALLAMVLDRDKAAETLGITRETLDKALPPIVAAVFSDPGSEWPETYENIAYAEKRCAEVGLPLITVRHEINVYVHRDTGEELRTMKWRSLDKETKQEYEKTSRVYPIFEWLMDSGSFPVIPGSGGHTCSMRFKGQVQQKWADKEFGDHEECNKHWLLGIESSEKGRSDRFTANRKKKTNQGKQILGHTYGYPLMDLGMDRKECLEMLEALGWEYDVQKSSCMWCPFVKEWEVDRLIDANGKGLEEALAIEERFYQTDKHAQWHADGEPTKSNGACFGGHHKQPYATGYCDKPQCADSNKHGKATLISLRYPNEGAAYQPHAKGKVRYTVKQHIERRKKALIDRNLKDFITD